MNTASNITGSTMGKEISLRIPRSTWNYLGKQLVKDETDEQFLFALLTQSKTADGTTFILRDILVPDENDLSVQGPGGVAPARDYQALTYYLAQQHRRSPLDAHTHPFQEQARFSAIDEMESAKNAKYISERFKPPVTHAMIVFGKGLRTHEAVVYDRSLRAYRTIDRIEIVGRGTEIRLSSRSRSAPDASDPAYDRQIIIPDWSQTTIARSRAVVIGGGGNGAQITQMLTSIGVGTEGWIAVIDPDIIERSNLPRIPYASERDVGQSKATMAVRYAGVKNPAVRVLGYPCSVTEDVVRERMAGASVLFGAGDNDGVRKVCDEMAVRHMIPYIDLGCDIQVSDDKVEAGGQVRVVLPGTNACLVCCRGYDPSAAAIDLMDDAHAAVHAARGYVRGSAAEPTPSVATLNATIAQLGMSAFLSLVHGERFGRWDYVHFDQFTAKTIVATTERREDCPLCGADGILGAGDDHREDDRPVCEWSDLEVKE